MIEDKKLELNLIKEEVQKILNEEFLLLKNEDKK